jgi:hypothetical protein
MWSWLIFFGRTWVWICKVGPHHLSHISSPKTSSRTSLKANWFNEIIVDLDSCFYSFIFIIAVLGVHCDIYKSSNSISNMSYLNSPPPTCSFIPPPPYSWNSFSRSHFSIYIQVYTVFAPYTPSFTSHWYQTPRHDLFCHPVLKTKHIFMFKIAIQEDSLWHFHVCMYVL